MTNRIVYKKGNRYAMVATVTSVTDKISFENVKITCTAKVVSKNSRLTRIHSTYSVGQSHTRPFQ